MQRPVFDCQLLSSSSRPNDRDVSDLGVTLVELMVGLTLVGILAVVATPALVRDQSDSEFKQAVNILAQNLNAARFEAVSEPTDRAFRPSGTGGYEITSVASGGSAHTTLKTVTLPSSVNLYAIIERACDGSGSPCSPSSGGNLSDSEVRFTGTSQVMVKPTSGALANSSATIYFQSRDSRYRSRIIIFGATGFVKTLTGW